MQAELYDYRKRLEFRQEYNLTAAPLQIDLLVVKKPRGVVIAKNIARIFRTDNLMEYKSPEDNLSVKDFWKACAYANLYAAITPGVNLSDVTLTFVENRHPRKLLRYLSRERGYKVEERVPGIYHIKGDYIPIQIIESRKLSEAENLWLNSLRKGLKKSSACAIEREKGRVPGVNLDAFLDTVIRSNPRIFLEVQNMAKRGETFEEVFTEAGLIPEWMERGRAQGLEQGRVQGMEKTARNLLAKNMPLEEIAEVTELPLEKIRALAVA
jgi:hypothetical protein